MIKPTSRTATLVAMAAALSLSACQAEEEEVSYETDVEDLSGGELIVSDPEAEGVEVELPETPMTAEAVPEAEPEVAE